MAYFPLSGQAESSPSPLSHALALAALGFRIHPLCPQDKKPRWMGWQSLATTEASVLTDWYATHPTDNVGMVTGHGSGVIALDIDRRHHGEQSLSTLEAMHVALPMTWQYTTHDGWRVLFRAPQDVTIGHGQLAPGIDVLGEGDNCVVPGSVHPKGSVYTWMDCYEPTTLLLADVPLWLCNVLKAKGILQYSSLQNRVKKLSQPATMPQSVFKPSSTQGALRSFPQPTTKPHVGNIRASKAPSPQEGGVSLLVERAATRPFPDPADPRKASLQAVDLLKDWDTVQACLPLLGLGHVEHPGEPFRCVFHPDEHASAAIAPPSEPETPGYAEYSYVDFHHEEHEGPLTIPLPLAYYCYLNGLPTSTKVPKPTLATWTLRLLRDAGVIAAAPVQAPRQPDETPWVAQRVYGLVQDLLSCKWLYKHGTPTAFTWEFGVEWSGGALSKDEVGEGLRWNLRHGYLQIARLAGNMATFALGTQALIRRLARRPCADETVKQVPLCTALVEDLKAMLKEPALHTDWMDVVLVRKAMHGLSALLQSGTDELIAVPG